MEIHVELLENQKLKATFENYTIFSDQPVDHKGEGTAPAPFDYFLASTALCAGYFVKAYCSSRNISTEGIKISQDNNKNPDIKYKQMVHLKIELPSHFTDKERDGILRSVNECSVKKTIQQMPEFHVEVV